METFEAHHELVNTNKERQGVRRGDGFVALEEFIEYYTNISCSIEQDSYFDLMISNAWNLEGSNNPASMPYAGTQRKVAQVNAREAYRQDHHRNLFGTDSKTPWMKSKKNQDQWVSTTQSSMQGGEIIAGQGAAGTNTFFNQDGYKNQFGSTRDANAGYQGMKHSDDELI